MTLWIMTLKTDTKQNDTKDNDTKQTDTKQNDTQQNASAFMTFIRMKLSTLALNWRTLSQVMLSKNDI